MTGEVGKVYAEALFSLCMEDGTLEPVYTELCACNQVLRDNPELVTLFCVPTIALKEKLGIARKLFSDNQTLCNLICMLIERGRIRVMDAITSAFTALYNDRHGVAEMTVTTSVALTPQLRERLIRKLSEKSGREVRLTERVDPGLIGGVLVQYGNTQIDNSIKSRLEAVRTQLKQ